MTTLKEGAKELRSKARTVRQFGILDSATRQKHLVVKNTFCDLHHAMRYVTLWSSRPLALLTIPVYHTLVPEKSKKAGIYRGAK